MPLVLFICFLTRIYLHDLLLFVMFYLLVRPYYSFFVIWYTFITSPSLYSLYHEVTNLIVLVSIRSSSTFINVAVCEKFALDNCVFWMSPNYCYYSHVLRAQFFGSKYLLSMIWYWNAQREILCHTSREGDRIHSLTLHSISLIKQ